MLTRTLQNTATTNTDRRNSLWYSLGSADPGTHPRGSYNNNYNNCTHEQSSQWHSLNNVDPGTRHLRSYNYNNNYTDQWSSYWHSRIQGPALVDLTTTTTTLIKRIANDTRLTVQIQGHAFVYLTTTTTEQLLTLTDPGPRSRGSYNNNNDDTDQQSYQWHSLDSTDPGTRLRRSYNYNNSGAATDTHWSRDTLSWILQQQRRHLSTEQSVTFTWQYRSRDTDDIYQQSNQWHSLDSTDPGTRTTFINRAISDIHLTVQIQGHAFVDLTTPPTTTTTTLINRADNDTHLAIQIKEHADLTITTKSPIDRINTQGS